MREEMLLERGERVCDGTAGVVAVVLRERSGRGLDGVELTSDSMLSERLTELSTAALVLRSVDEGPPLAVRYELTAAGRALLPALEQISRWADQHLAVDEPSRA